MSQSSGNLLSKYVYACVIRYITLQLKNMINALFSSQEGGTRMFTAADGTTFGWKAILDLYARECQRRDQGCARMVPKLREVHVIRDAWTKLNVLPAKIMQVCCHCLCI